MRMYQPHSLVHQWRATDRAQILTLLALVTVMGVVHKPILLCTGQQIA